MTRAVGMALTVAVAVVAALWISIGIGGVLYAPVFVLAASPGLPIGFLLFGRRHAAGWVAGGLLGYGLTQLALWAVIAAGHPSTPAFAIAWLLLIAAAEAARRFLGPGPVTILPSWMAADARGLLVVLALVLLVMGVVYRNLGRADADGNRYYRAYFTADFLWHAALAHELGKFSLPPRNPYLAPRAMNYYWAYFLLPATVAARAPSALPALRDVQPCLKANAMLAGLLMMAALFLLVRTAVGSPGTAALAVTLAMLAASAEALYAIVDLVSRGRPLSALLDMNIDAVTAWYFQGLRVDNIPRSLWYTPQHTTSVGLGLIALLVTSTAGAAARPLAIAGAGAALGLSTVMNPLIGAACSLIYGVCIVADVAVNRTRPMLIVRHAIAAVPVVLAVAVQNASRVTEGAASVVNVGFSGFSRNRPVLTLLLSLGPVLVPALAGLRRPMRAPRAVAIASTGILLGLFLLYFVRISEASWVGFRAGQILLVSIPILLARTLESLSATSRGLLCAAILVAGLPTTLVDTWNAQDIGNRRPGPGFRWTLWTTPAQQDAFRWIARETPATAIVQMEPMVRGREHWTLIPSFAGRRMAAGLPISLLPLPEYAERSALVRTLFATSDAREAWTIARRLRLDYIYVDRDDVSAYPEGTTKFDAAPQLFSREYGNGEVRVYRVQ